MGKRYSSSQALFAFGPHQTNFQTVVAPSTIKPNYRQIVKEGYDVAEYDSGSTDNSGESTGSVFPDEIYPTRDTTAFSAVEQLTYQLLGIRLFDAMGVVTTEVLSVGAVWRHTFTLLDPTVAAALPSRPLAIKGGGDPAAATNQIYDALMPSMVFNRLTIAADSTSDKPNLQADSEWIGSGQFTTPSGVNFVQTPVHVWNKGALGAAHKTNINKLGGIVTFYPNADLGGTPVATECIVRNQTTTINENINTDGGYGVCGLFQDGDPTKGAIASSLDTGGQTIESSLTLDADSQFLIDFNFYNRLKAKTPFSLKTVYTGPLIATGFNHKVTFNINKAVITGHGFPDVAGGKRGLSLNLALLANGNIMPFSVVLETNVENFATYVGA